MERAEALERPAARAAELDVLADDLLDAGPFAHRDDVLAAIRPAMPGVYGARTDTPVQPCARPHPQPPHPLSSSCANGRWRGDGRE